MVHKRLAFCTYDKPNYINGPNRALIKLIPELIKKGYECYLLVLTHDEPEKCESMAFFKETGANVISTRFHGNTVDSVNWFLDQVYEHKIDIFIPNIVATAYFACKWLPSNCRSVGIIRSNDDYHHGLIDVFVRNDGFNLDSWVAVSDFLLDIIQYSASNGEIIKTISSGTQIPDEVTSFSSSPFRVAYIGRLEKKQKNIDVILDHSIRLVQGFPNVEFHFYGNGSHKKIIDERISEAKLQERVINHGLIDSYRLEKELSRIHVIVLFSDYEGMPSALMEAMAMGVVPLCWREASGVNSLIANGENGIIIEPHNYDSYQTSIQHLISDRNFWNELSKNAREHIIRSHSIEVNAKKWDTLLKEIISSRSVSSDDKEAVVRPIITEQDLPGVHPALAREDFRHVRKKEVHENFTKRVLRKLRSYVR